jgi:1,4-dihydroxy-2-naphthoate octaprenyltransferase
MLSVILVFIAGLLIARADGYSLPPEPIAWGFAGLLLLSLSIHYTNEYADYETDALTTPTRYSGGSGVLPSGDVPRELAMQAAWVTLVMGSGILIAAVLLDIVAPITLMIAWVGTFFGWMYSLPPLKLAWHGWGELDNAILGGTFLPLYGYSTVTGDIRLWVVLVSLPFTLLVFNNLLATTWADREADSQVGKNTLAVLWPVSRLRMLYGISFVGAFSAMVGMKDHTMPCEVVYGSLLAIPLLVLGGVTYTRIHNPYPTSNAMVMFIVGQMVGWFLIA